MFYKWPWKQFCGTMLCNVHVCLMSHRWLCYVHRMFYPRPWKQFNGLMLCNIHICLMSHHWFKSQEGLKGQCPEIKYFLMYIVVISAVLSMGWEWAQSFKPVLLSSYRPLRDPFGMTSSCAHLYFALSFQWVESEPSHLSLYCSQVTAHYVTPLEWQAVMLPLDFYVTLMSS